MASVRNRSKPHQTPVTTLGANHPTSAQDQQTSSPRSLASPTSPSRRKKDDYVRRPRNPFMIYRSHLYHTKQIVEKNQGNLSSVAARMWNELPDKEKAPFQELAAQEKEQHRLMYPGYSFTPGKKQTLEDVMFAPVTPKGKAASRTATRASAAPAGGVSKTRAKRSRTPPPPIAHDIEEPTASTAQGTLYPKPFEPPVLYLAQQQQKEYDEEMDSDYGSCSSRTDENTLDGSLSPATPYSYTLDDFAQFHAMPDDDPIFDFPEDGVILTPDLEFDSFVQANASNNSGNNENAMPWQTSCEQWDNGFGFGGVRSWN